jgi:hypothetical protein
VKIMDLLKDSVKPLLILLVSFLLTDVLLIAAFVEHGTFDNFMDASWESWSGNDFIPTGWGVTSIIILIAALAAGFSLWYLRASIKATFIPYIACILIVIGGIFLQIILYQINVIIIW